MFEVETKIAHELKSRGFGRRGLTWRRKLGSMIQVVNLQREGRTVFVNLGVYYGDIEPRENPAENNCHVRARLERVCEPSSFEVIRSFEFDSPAPQALVDALTGDGLNFLDRISSLSGLREVLDSPEPKNYFVHRLAREWCGASAGV
jgi:hypothetical protein